MSRKHLETFKKADKTIKINESTTMRNRELMKKLSDQFERQCQAFEQKRTKFLAELDQDLATLRKSFGEDLINERLGDLTRTVTTTPPKPESTESPAPVVNNVRPQRKRRKASNFNDLKPHVVEIVKTLAGQRFTVRDIKDALNQREVKFNPNNLHLILIRYLSGIKVVDKQKGKGINKNVYEAGGDVSLVNYTVASKK